MDVIAYKILSKIYNRFRFGVRFPPLCDAYDYSLRTLMRRTASELGLSGVHEGVYVYQAGPCFETIAECRMMRLLGADSAGRSTKNCSDSTARTCRKACCNRDIRELIRAVETKQLSTCAVLSHLFFSNITNHSARAIS